MTATLVLAAPEVEKCLTAGAADEAKRENMVASSEVGLGSEEEKLDG